EPPGPPRPNLAPAHAPTPHPFPLAVGDRVQNPDPTCPQLQGERPTQPPRTPPPRSRPGVLLFGPVPRSLHRLRPSLPRRALLRPGLLPQRPLLRPGLLPQSPLLRSLFPRSPRVLLHLWALPQPERGRLRGFHPLAHSDPVRPPQELHPASGRTPPVQRGKKRVNKEKLID